MPRHLACFALLISLGLGCEGPPAQPTPSRDRHPTPSGTARSQEEAQAPAKTKTITVMIPARGRDRGQETLREEDIPSPSAPMIPARRDPTSAIDPSID